MKYKPGRETLIVAGYRIDLSTGPLLPPIGRCKHVGLTAVYEQKAGSVRRIPHGIDNVYGRTGEEAVRKMKEAVRRWFAARESQKRSHRVRGKTPFSQ